MRVYTVCVHIPTETREAYKQKNHTEEAKTLTTLWKINDCYMSLDILGWFVTQHRLQCASCNGYWELRHSWCRFTLDSCLALLTEVEYIHIIALTEKVHI